MRLSYEPTDTLASSNRVKVFRHYPFVFLLRILREKGVGVGERDVPIKKMQMAFQNQQRDFLMAHVGNLRFLQ